ncbi:MAG: DUF599 domain-containing protein [Pseudomonadota bacterium]
MNITPHILPLGPLDAAAVAVLFAAYFGIGWRIEAPVGRPSVSIIMARYRHEWMAQFVIRGHRIFDAAILQNLRDGTAFFASTCLLAIGGLLALVGNPAPLEMAAARLPRADAALASDPLVWQVKLLVPVVFLTSAFLRFVWANRLFGYFSVLIGSVPMPVEEGPAEPTPAARHRATQAARINVRAAVNFNRGLRAIYFALTALAWLLGPWALGGATAITLLLLYSREFRSLSRDILADDPPPLPPKFEQKG